MTGFFMFLHALICLLLVVVILMQSGRGGGLTEAFASAESMFGANTNEFLIKGTTILASIFLITSLSLAVMSAQKGKSLMTDSVVEEVHQEAVDTAAKVEKAVEEVTEAVEEAIPAVVPEEPKGSAAD